LDGLEKMLAPVEALIKKTSEKNEALRHKRLKQYRTLLDKTYAKETKIIRDGLAKVKLRHER